MDSSQSFREQVRRRRRQKIWWLVKLVLFTAASAAACFYGWRFLHSPSFAFGSVSIHGTSLLTEADVISLAGCGKGPLNLFNASTSRVREALSHDVRFQNTEAAYRFPATLQVSVEERQPALYVANSYRSYLKLDYNGIVISVTTTIPDAKAPVLAGVKCGNLYLGDRVEDEGVLQILKFLQQLTPEAQQRIGEIAVDNKQEVKLQLSGCFPVRLGKAQELEQKAPLFMTVFNEIKDKNIKAEYIDLTFAKPYIKLLPKQGTV